MFRKVITSLLLTIIVLAFPLRILHLSSSLEATLKIGKGFIFIGLIGFLMHREGFVKSRLLFQSIKRTILLKLLPVFLLIAGYVGYFWNKDLADYHGSLQLLALSLAGTFIAASAEEVIFRGYLLNLFKKYNYTFFMSLVFSSVFFSLIHIVNIFRFEDGWAVFNQLIFAFALGMLLGSIFALTNNLLLVSVLHFLINIPSSIKRISASSINDPVFTQTTLTENLLSTLFFIVIMAPVLMLSLYYVKLTNKLPYNSTSAFH